MILLRVYLVAVLLVLVASARVVGINHGWDLPPVLFDDIARMG